MACKLLEFPVSQSYISPDAVGLLSWCMHVVVTFFMYWYFSLKFFIRHSLRLECWLHLSLLVRHIGLILHPIMLHLHHILLMHNWRHWVHILFLLPSYILFCSSFITVWRPWWLLMEGALKCLWMHFRALYNAYSIIKDYFYSLFF